MAGACQAEHPRRAACVSDSATTDARELTAWLTAFVGEAALVTLPPVCAVAQPAINVCSTVTLSEPLSSKINFIAATLALKIAASFLQVACALMKSGFASASSPT